MTISDGTAEAPEYRTTVPCPAWCSRGSGHGFEDVAANVNEGLLFRAHEVDLGRHVWVSADEYAVGDDGPVWETLEPLVFLAKSDCMTSEDARAIAAELLLAADLVERARRGA